MKHGIFVMGPEINQFEKNYQNFAIGIIALNSGTYALYLALKSLNLKKTMKLSPLHYTGLAIKCNLFK